MKFKRNKQTINYILILSIVVIVLAIAYSNGLFGQPTARYFPTVFSYIFFVLIFDWDNYKRIKALFKTNSPDIIIYRSKDDIARLTIFLTLISTIAFGVFYIINKSIPAMIICLYLLTLVMILGYWFSIYLSQD